MQAWQVRDAGHGFEKAMRLASTNRPPPPKKGQALVKVRAMSLNPADYKLLEDWPFLCKVIFGNPVVPGLDLCGEIVQLPSSGAPSDLKQGQLVYGRMALPSKYGPLAEYAIAATEGLVPVSSGLSAEHASSYGICALTAYQGLVPYVKPGFRVFINGGSGGTGVFAIQIAKLLGCHVVASCSGPNEELCKSLGADETIDYRAVDIVKVLAAKGVVFDLVLDLVGKRYSLHRESVQFLKPDGLYVQVAASTDSAAGYVSMLRSWVVPRWLGGVPRRWKSFTCVNNREQLLEIAKWVEAGKLKTIIDSTHSFEDAKEAYVKLKTGHARGKIVVTVTRE